MSAAKDIERLRRAIEDKVAWGPASSWHSKMFEELSAEIFKATQVSLSVATLKRFFDVVKYEGTPSVTTLDTLSMYLGDKNWTAFKTKKKKKTWSMKSPGKTVYVTAGFVLAIITITLFSNRRPNLVINSSEFEFSSTVLSTEFPNSVVFDFSIPDGLIADSFKIQQYWDPTKTIVIDRAQSQATAIYYHPGYFEAKLLVDGQTAKTHDLFLKSDGWLGQIEYPSTPKYFPPVVEGSSLSAPREIYEEIASLDQRTITSFHFIDDLGDVSGDNFQLRASIRNTFDDRWAVCHAIWVYVLATDGAFVIPFAKIGCSSDNNMLLNDIYLDGKSNDLSALSADFSETTLLDINVKDQQVTISIDKRAVFQKSYSDSMGNVVGMRFKFAGLGEVMNYELTDQNGGSVSL